MFRSRVEMEISVLNDAKFPTADSKYWQSVREQGVHFEQLVMLSYEYRKAVQKIKILGARKKQLEYDLSKLTTESPDWEREKLEAEIEIKRIEVDRWNFILVGQLKTAKDRIREVLNWHDIMLQLRPSMMYGTDSYEDHQLQSYNMRFGRMLTAAQQTGANFGPAEAANLLGQKRTSDRVLSGQGLKLGSQNQIEKIASGQLRQLVEPGDEKAKKIVQLCSKCKNPVNPQDKNCPNCGVPFDN